jgi:hypothetical protein
MSKLKMTFLPNLVTLPQCLPSLSKMVLRVLDMDQNSD